MIKSLVFVAFLAFLALVWVFAFSGGEEPLPTAEWAAQGREVALRGASDPGIGLDPDRLARPAGGTRVLDDESQQVEKPVAVSVDTRVLPVYPDGWRDNAAVEAIAAHLGVGADDVIAEIYGTWPALLTQEIAPLAPWDLSEDELVRKLVDPKWGPPEIRFDMFAFKVLGSPYAAYVGKKTDLGDGDDLFWEASADVTASLTVGFSTYEALVREFELAVRSKVRQGKYDRFPYLGLDSHKEHTDLPGQKALYKIATTVGGNWVCMIDLYTGNFPELGRAMQDFEDLKGPLKSEVDLLLKTYK